MENNNILLMFRFDEDPKELKALFNKANKQYPEGKVYTLVFKKEVHESAGMPTCFNDILEESFGDRLIYASNADNIIQGFLELNKTTEDVHKKINKVLAFNKKDYEYFCSSIDKDKEIILIKGMEVVKCAKKE